MCGAMLDSIRVTDLNFADDVDILSDSLEALVAAIDAFSNEAKPLGRDQNKIQKFGGLLGELIVNRGTVMNTIIIVIIFIIIISILVLVSIELPGLLSVLS